MKRIGRNKSNIGIIGEDIAQKWLISKGYTIITTNFKTYYGEIDVVAQKESETYFIEVKTVSVSHGTSLYSPEDNFTVSKSLKMHKAIEYYLLIHPEVRNYQITLLCVFLDKIKKTARVRVYNNPGV